MSADYRQPFHTSYSPEALRGVIIADTNVLYYLDAGIHNDCRTSTPSGNLSYPRRYLDILPMLSQHGYEIIIPEMVAYETASVLANGKDVDSYFPRPDGLRSKVYRRDMKRFLYDVAAGKYPHIRIEPGSEPPEVAAFLGTMHDILDHRDKPSARIVGQLMELQAMEHEHYGDMSIAALLAHDSGVRSWGREVFAFSDDHGVQQDASQYSGVNILNSTGFFHAVVQSGLWKGMGMDPDIDMDRLLTDVQHQVMLAQASNTAMRSNMDFRPEDHRKYMEHTLQGSHPCPFLDALRALVTEHGWDRRDNVENLRGTHITQPSALERFNMRHGMDWRERHDQHRSQEQAGESVNEPGAGGR